MHTLVKTITERRKPWVRTKTIEQDSTSVSPEVSARVSRTAEEIDVPFMNTLHWYNNYNLDVAR